MNNTAIVVLGMHRSGTSALTGALNELGVTMGKHLIPPQKGVNERGFWENSWVVEANDELLLSLGSCWDDWLPIKSNWTHDPIALRYKRKIVAGITREFSSVPLWAVKDPRMCRLLPLWKQVFSEVATTPLYLLVWRQPSQVVNSLVKRDGFSKEKALLLWLVHNVEMERETRDARRMILSFDQLLKESTSSLERLEACMGVNFPVSIERAQSSIESFLSEKLVHHKESGLEGSGLVNEAATKMLGALQTLASKPDLPENSMREVTAQFDEVHERLSEFFRHQDPVLLEQIRNFGLERGKYEVIWSNIERLWSWRLLAPIRFIEKRLRDLR